MRFFTAPVTWIVAGLATAGCVASVATTPPPVEVSRCATETTAPAPPPVNAAKIAAAVAAEVPGAEVGFVLADASTGKPLTSHNGTSTYYAASVSKLLIAVHALADGNTDKPAITTMLSASDDAIASALWVRHGASGIVDATARSMRLTGTEPPRIPGQWGMVTTTPADVARAYAYVLQDLDPPAEALVSDALAAATKRGTDGVDQTFGLPSAFGEVAVKQGWMQLRNTLVLNTTGTVTAGGERYIVALLTHQPATTPMAKGMAAVTAGADALAAQLKRRGPPAAR